MADVPALSGHALLLLLLQLAALLVVSRLLAEGARRLGQPAVVGELLAGILLGPSLLGWIWPGGLRALFPPVAEQVHLLELVAWLGMVLLLLRTGLETDVRLLRHLGRPALTASLMGMIVPFAAGFVFGELVPAAWLRGSRHLFAAFFATAMSITAMPVLAKILFDLELTRRNIGVVILSAGVVDDVTGWVVLSMIAGIAKDPDFSPWHLARTVGLTLGFVVAARFLAWPALRWLFRVVDDRSHTRDNELALVAVATFLFAAATEWIGIHAVFGAFVAGCVMRQVPRVRPATLDRLETVTMAIFAPVFFGLVGLKVNLRTLGDPWMLLIVLGLATASKLVGCTLGGLLGRLTLRESLAIGAGMNARGAMELVVALIGLQLGILNEAMFSIVVMIAVITSFMAPLSLRWIMRGVPITPEEHARIAGETQLGLFDPRHLKALLPTAGGPNALVAAGIAAAVVRGEGAAVTALYVDRSPGGLLARLRNHFRPDLAGQNLQQHLESLRALAAARSVRLDVRRLADVEVEQAIRKEAARGSDLVLVGASGRARQPLRTDLIAALLADVPAHLAIVRSRPDDAGAPPHRRVLVASDGSYFTRAAVELAVLYAEGTGAQVTVLYVMEPTGLAGEGESALDEGFRRMMATTVLATLSPLLGATRAHLTVIVREDDQLNRPVLRELRQGPYDLLFIGAEARAVQHRLSIGYDVEGLVDGAPCTAVVVVPRIGGGKER